jgi:prevent-host-death family protein
MAELTVGIRDLKARLSLYLEQVQQGQTIVVTSHGRPIAQITPRKEDLMERVKALQAAGLIEWNGKKLPKLSKPPAQNLGDKLASDIIVEMRNESLY